MFRAKGLGHRRLADYSFVIAWTLFVLIVRCQNVAIHWLRPAAPWGGDKTERNRFLANDLQGLSCELIS